MTRLPSRVSVVINTLNEERNLSYALRSVQPWVDEIVVVDMHSEDRTVEIARSYGARVFFHDRIPAFDAARAFAIGQASEDWVLLLDADEVVPEPLSRRLKEIARDDEADVVNISWLNYLLGAPLTRTGWGPRQDKHKRFFKRSMVTTSATVHDFLKSAPGARVLDLGYRPGLAVAHFNYLDTAQFIEKLNRYTSIEAQQAYEKGVRVGSGRALYGAGREFLYRYLRKRGFRDGWRGLYLSGLMAMYRWATYAKLRELESVGGRESVLDTYKHEKEGVLKGYDREARRGDDG